MGTGPGGFNGRVSSRGAGATGASGEGVGTALWPGTGTDKPLEIVKGRSRKRNFRRATWCWWTTAGRLHIDDDLNERAEHAEERIAAPARCFSIADSMIGQDAGGRRANSTNGWLTGVILTKLDGDARGGAALSIGKLRAAGKIRGPSVKNTMPLEGFYPERIVSRVLGMGRLMSLIETRGADGRQKSSGGTRAQAAQGRIHAGGFPDH